MQPTTTHDNQSVHSQNEITLTSNVYQDDLKKMATYDEEKNIAASSFPADQKVQEEDLLEEESYPGLVECAPFPALASLDEITHTLTKTKTNQTFKSQRAANIAGGDNDSLKTTAVDPQDEKSGIKTIGEYYGTEGIKNPGWMAVFATFLVNFFIFGTIFSWGNFQRL
ncbi:hypothetical protein BDA99DRAFT_163833 [Phascolomyces articulosus]|uniref:Uncharacterized protein n=1 Tax=Phascolomyces articulosus TaxID=60185 RepID=A0AAD5PAH7_9FUNG|nr:hypothetical protein BDA99DRAFT_163833 [Phascolomyces articulosus]